MSVEQLANVIEAISHMTFSNAFSWKQLFEFRLKFHWSLFLSVQLLIFHHWFRQWLGAGQATSHCLNQWRLVYWCIYASHGLNELKNMAKYITWHNHNKTSMTKTVCIFHGTYRQVSHISRTKSQHSKDSRTVLRLPLPNPLKPDVKSRMKM